MWLACLSVEGPNELFLHHTRGPADSQAHGYTEMRLSQPPSGCQMTQEPGREGQQKTSETAEPRPPPRRLTLQNPKAWGRMFCQQITEESAPGEQATGSSLQSPSCTRGSGHLLSAALQRHSDQSLSPKAE